MKPDRQYVQVSVLDRLIDNEPAISHEPVQDGLFNFWQIKASVIRDLENLLNTRNLTPLPPPGCKELHNSLYVYGLRDYTSLNPKSPSVREQLRRDMEKAVAKFEPRFKNVKVRIEAPMQNERTVRFRITALLVLESMTEPVTFDTLFDVNRSEYVIQK